MRLLTAAAVAFALVPGTAGQWERLEPGGATGCGRGSDFAFHFRAGTVNKLVIDFEGGGGCWDAVTCALPTWEDTAGGPPGNNGLASDRADNPTANWNYLFVPYCTGDVHVGAGELPVWNVAFNGRANAAAALEYAYERVAEPETVLVTGCSAGSLGAVVWSRWVAAHYANARHIQFGDSYIGVTSPTHWATLDENWDLLSAFYPAEGLDRETLSAFRDDICPYIVEATARSDPTGQYAQFTYNSDTVQAGFSVLAGNTAPFTGEMRRIIGTAAEAVNSGYFIAAGTSHCIIPGGSLYTVGVEDELLVDWLAAIIEGRPRTQVIDCCPEPPAGGKTIVVAAAAAAAAGANNPLDLAMKCAADWLYHSAHGQRWAVRSANLTKNELPQLRAEFAAACGPAATSLPPVV